MCGIAGYISFNDQLTEQRLQKATALLQHRGPDAAGFYFTENKQVGLSHRRLSILDLSTAANQPFFSADGNYCMVYNGEVYNFNELKNELADKGQSLRTTSDTEVILELFAQQGPACFSKLNGMFTFAIFDKQRNQLTLCRDHVGIKPLFYYVDDSNFIFGSELKVIHSMMAEKLAINKTAFPYFMHLGFIPEPLTIYNNSYKFPSAHYVQIDTSKNSLSALKDNITPFWKLKNKISETELSSEPVAKKQLSDLLFDSVQHQLLSDVSVGTFLSGGVDSSIITAIASKIGGHKSIKTFSISFEEEKFNESAYALQVATHLNTDHHPLVVKENDVLELIDQLLPAYDEPFADSSAFPTMIVSRLARKQVTVALSGDGGDELFHGYGMYNWAKRLSAPVIPFVKGPLYLASRFMNNKYQRSGNMFAYPSKDNMLSHIFSQEQYFFHEAELTSLLVDPTFDFLAINKMDDLARPLSAPAKQSLWDFDHYLKDDLLVKVDRASMQYSLETRVPLLDRRLVEFAYNLSDELKVKNGHTKYLLKQVLYDHVPKKIFDRPKWGFGIPLSKWLKTDLKYLLDKYTSEAMISQYNVLHYAEVEKLRTDYLKGKDYLYNRLWLIIVLHWWLDEHQL